MATQISNESQLAMQLEVAKATGDTRKANEIQTNLDLLRASALSADSSTGFKSTADKKQQIKDPNKTVATLSKDELKSNSVQITYPQSLTSGYTSPFSIHLQNAYATTTRVGNNMLPDQDMMGSPAIFNPLAVIRFQQVAGANQHTKLIDQAGNFAFRSASFSPAKLNINNLPDNVTIGSTQSKDGQTATSFKKPDNTDTSLGAVTINGETTQNVYADVTGEMYAYEPVPNQWRWTCINVAGLTEDEKPNYMVILPASSVSGDTPNPTMIQYWVDRYGLVLDDKGNITSPQIIEQEKINTENLTANPKKENVVDAKQALEIQNVINNSKAKIDQNRKAWNNCNVEQVYEKRYINHPNPEQMLPSDELLPSMENLCNVDNWKGDEQFIYEPADFLYCKYFDLIPNNHLITLRRFVVPVYDNAKASNQDSDKQFNMPIARAVTWLEAEEANKITELLSIDWKLMWKEQESQINTIEDANADKNLSMDGLFGESKIGSSISKGLMFTTMATQNPMSLIMNKGDAQSALQQQQQFEDDKVAWRDAEQKQNPLDNGQWANQVLGPVNAIVKTTNRERGIEGFNKDITLTFHYSLMDIGGINPKAAMLDLIANFLVLTYNEAGFWGGANRFFTNRKNYPFLGGAKAKQAFMQGNFSGFTESITTSLLDGVAGLGDMFQALFLDPSKAIGALKSAVSGGFKSFATMKSAKARPNTIAFKGLLDGSPVGEWHLVIGNPFNPMMMIGNLIMQSAKLEPTTSVLGTDDFPIEWKMTVTLKSGRPRDSGDIQSMFNRGSGKLYYAPEGQKEPAWLVSSATNITAAVAVDGRSNVSRTGAEIAAQTEGSYEYSQKASSKPSPERAVYPGSRSKTATLQRNLDEYQIYKKYFRNNATKLGNDSAYKNAQKAALKSVLEDLSPEQQAQQTKVAEIK